MTHNIYPLKGKTPFSILIFDSSCSEFLPHRTRLPFANIWKHLFYIWFPCLLSYQLLSKACIAIFLNRNLFYLLERSIELKPDEGPSKYMNLGQITAGAEAVAAFRKGIELLQKELKQKAGRGVCHFLLFLHPSCFYWAECLFDHIINQFGQSLFVRVAMRRALSWKDWKRKWQQR